MMVTQTNTNTAKLKELESLNALLAQGDDKDIGLLSDYITNNGEGRLSLDDDVCSRLVGWRIASSFDSADRKLIADEICRFGGNTIMNFFRKKGVEYREVVVDVAKHLDALITDDFSTAELESAILSKLLGKAMERMSSLERVEFDTQLKAGGVDISKGLFQRGANFMGANSLAISALLATIFAQQLVRGGVAVDAEFILGRAATVALGPVAWIAAGVWSVADLASPAYRVTVPCVIQIAFMRQKILQSTPPSVSHSE